MSDYSDWTRKVFGVAIPQPGFIHSMQFWSDPEWNQKAHVALLDVELKYVELLLENIREHNVPGALVEFGVYEGWWVNHLYEASERLSLHRKVIGYDSFQGLSKPDNDKDLEFWKEGQYAVDLEVVSRNVKKAKRPRIELIPGFFSESLVRDDALRIGAIAFARIDCDIYAPALECLNYLTSRLSHGSILVFDDWPHLLDFGECLAFREWLETVDQFEFELLFAGTYGHLYLRVWFRGKERWKNSFPS
jgi:hypothetical protein